MSFRFLTAGESHGRALTGILEGLPAGLVVTAEDIHRELRRRKKGHGRGARQKIEDDTVEILSGIRHGKTLGSPISLVIWNKDWRNWEHILQAEPFTGEVKRPVEVPRPGHADLTGGLKYGHTDMRNVLERASARETTMRVALGAIALRFLDACGVRIASRVVSIGSVEDKTEIQVPIHELNAIVDNSPVRCLGNEAEVAMVEEIDRCKREGDTLGGTFEVIAEGVPLGLGSYVHWDRRLEGALAENFLSLNAIKGVEVGLGFGAGRTPGSQAHDEIFPGENPGRYRYGTNRSGGIDGGMTTGQPLVVRAAMKPLATLMSPLKSVRLSTHESETAHVERSDVCAVPSAAVIGESLMAFTLAAAIMEKFGGDSMAELLPRLESWNASTRLA